MIRYRTAVVDPGGSWMRAAVARHLRDLQNDPRAEPIRHVLATHGHEEHCGNLEFVAKRTGAQLHASPDTLPLLLDPPQIPLVRRLVIGQPPRIVHGVIPLAKVLHLGPAPEDVLQVVATPGHCADHSSLYCPADRLLLLGDAFMGAHFTSPNPEVDHEAWIDSLRRLLELDVEIMIEGHGHVYTRRQDVLTELHRQGLGRLATEQTPREALTEKLEFLCWMREQIRQARQEGLPARVTRATMFPWTKAWSYQSALMDLLVSALTLGHFGRHRMLATFAG